MLTMMGESMKGAAASKLESNEKTFPSSVFGTTLVTMERMTIAGVEEKMHIPAPEMIDLKLLHLCSKDDDYV